MYVCPYVIVWDVSFSEASLVHSSLMKAGVRFTKEKRRLGKCVKEFQKVG